MAFSSDFPVLNSSDAERIYVCKTLYEFGFHWDEDIQNLDDNLKMNAVTQLPISASTSNAYVKHAGSE